MINWVIQAEETKTCWRPTRNGINISWSIISGHQWDPKQLVFPGLLISYWDQPNVFVVGDDDQSIYRFQGANVENMVEFRTRL